MTDTDISIKRERFDADLAEEILPVLAEHYEETGLIHAGHLDVNVLFYITAEINGMLRAYVARGPEGIVGYCSMFVVNHPHYQHTVQAMQDALFVNRRFRRLIGPRLIRYVDDCLATEGVAVVHRDSNQRRNIGILLERMGYKVIATSYARRLNCDEPLHI